MRRLMTRPIPLAIAGAGLALIAFLAFGVFGIHTAFIDQRVDEANPFAAVSTPAESEDGSQLAPDESDESDESDEEASAPDTAEIADDTDTADPPADAAEDGTDPTVEELARGQLIDRSHSGDGTAVVLTDGDRRVLRFEDDFAIDNGPDLNVFLVAGADADADADTFDDDFIDLGDLKGNIGAQNYEIPDDVDLEQYDTVVIWCVRFGVAFNAADLV